MLLDNFYRACQGTTGRNFTGSIQYSVNITSSPTTANYYTVTGTGWYCDVGFDDTPVTHDDYVLGDSNAVGASAGTLTYLSGVTLNTYPSLRTCISVFKNDGDTDVVVKELGMVDHQNNTNPNNSVMNYLIARKVLDTPITVPAGATMAFTYSIDMDFSESTGVN